MGSEMCIRDRDAMEEGLKIDFDDLREEEPEASLGEEGKLQP